MSNVGQVVAQMVSCGMPSLPPNHPVLDGAFKRFGPKKKAWYVLREITLKSGRVVITGAFGINRGADHGTIPVSIDAEEMTEEERTEFANKQRAIEKAQAEKREKESRLAANRARDQWRKATSGIIEHPYLDRKQVDAEGLRLDVDGTLLIPAVRAGQLIGLQKIDREGDKRFNTGMDKPGAFHMLGEAAGAAMIGVGEGYATCRSARIGTAALNVPVAVAFDAGNIGPVAKVLRVAYPDAHLLFLADDDYQLAERFAERLREDYKVSVSVPVDAATHTVLADDGAEVLVTAQWREDPQGVPYIEADMRSGRRVETAVKFKNAGVASCMAAARAVGNASVVMPQFTNRAGRKLTDFNDLHVDEGLDVVAAQLGFAVLAAKQPEHAFPVLPAAPAANHALTAGAAAAGPESGAGVVPSNPPRPSEANAQPGKADPAVSTVSMVDYAPAADIAAARLEEGNDELSSNPPRPLEANAQPGEAASPVTKSTTLFNPPPPLETNAQPALTGFVPLAWALAHCVLIQGSTDVWDSLNKLRMKRPAFVSMVGKESAKAWEGSAERRSISPRNLPKVVRGVADENGGTGGDSIVMMLERYTFLYGTKTVYDHEKKLVLGYDAMALARGSDLASRWLSHPLHMEKDLDKLVFDPTQRVDLNTHINMFEGFPLTPKRDEVKADLALSLLYSLCATESDQDEVFKWVLCWLALPLQRPGAKMQTGLLFFGEKQGTGKSLFFEGIMKPMYGAHGATGGQNQLDANYTMWRSQKLFVLFEEILSRQDKYSHFGVIKHMITGRDTAISQKFKDDRTEANHMNVVMLSNEFQAIPLEPHDRRFLVVDVRNLLDADLLARVTAALKDGLIEAFYAFLLAYPLGDFTEHTKPIMTAAKQRVINFGRPDWEAFYLAWEADELDAPYCSCLSNDLFIVYDRYCSRYKLRGQSLTKFAELMGNRLKKDRQWVTIGAKKKLLTVLHVPQKDDEEVLTISKQCERFRELADIRALV